MLIECDQCTAGYRSAKALRQHKRDRHGERRSCPYPGCTYTYARSRHNHLTSHIRNAHKVLKDQEHQPFLEWEMQNKQQLRKVVIAAPETTQARTERMLEEEEAIPFDFDPLHGFSDIPSPEPIELEEAPLFEPPRRVCVKDTVIPPKEQMTTHQTEVTTHQMEVTTPQMEMTTHQTEVTTHQTEVTTPQMEMTTYQTEVTTHQTEMTTHQTMDTTQVEEDTVTPVTTEYEKKMVADSIPQQSEDTEKDETRTNDKTEKEDRTRTRNTAKEMLHTGCMPLFPPAMRDWTRVKDESIQITETISWPPRQWKDLSADNKLLKWEMASSHLHGDVTISRNDLLERYNFLALPGTADPRMVSSPQIRTMRHGNFCVVREIALTGEDTQEILRLYSASYLCRTKGEDEYINTLKDVPLYL